MAGAMVLIWAGDSAVSRAVNSGGQRDEPLAVDWDEW